jgi:pimeloyl-ACP methyl ester carboxylesterase
MDDQNLLARTTKLEIAYTESGPADGPLVMLVHGWPDATRTWTAVAARLAAAGFRTIVPDLRGAGNTRFLSPDTPRDGSGVALAQDVIDLADALGIDCFDVVGHDWGARTAYTLAALFPGRIGRTAGLALQFQPKGVFKLPYFSQARKFSITPTGCPLLSTLIGGAGVAARCRIPRMPRCGRNWRPSTSFRRPR